MNPALRWRAQSDETCLPQDTISTLECAITQELLHLDKPWAVDTCSVYSSSLVTSSRAIGTRSVSECGKNNLLQVRSTPNLLQGLPIVIL